MGRIERLLVALVGMRRFVAGILLLVLLASWPQAWAGADETVKIGVLAFRPKPQTLAQWQPLVEVLSRGSPGRKFVVEALTYPEMEEAVARRRIDFVLTNPGHYVLLTRRIGLTAPLATLAVNDYGRPSTMFGGVIFVRSDRADLQLLRDLRGRTIAATSMESLGGYQMQAYELSLQSVRLPQDAKLATTGMPHDKVVDAVLSGRADAGFVRTGVLESMVQEGKLKMAQIRVVNPQSHPGFPQQASTRLYPEWPFASLPGIDENLARHVAASLFALEEDEKATRAIGIHGFVVPADYTPVVELLKELRMPPFEHAPRFRLEDVWDQYRWQLLAMLLATAVVLSLAARLLYVRRRLEQQQGQLIEQKRALQESEAHLQTVIQNEPECIKIIDASGRLRQMNPAGLAMIEAETLEQVVDRPILNLIAPAYRQAFKAMHGRVMAGETVQMEFEVLGLKGGRRWLETHAVPMRDHGEVVHLAVTRDITERKRMEDQIRRLAFYDPLTGLPNRRLLNDRLEQTILSAKRYRHCGAMMFLDLDNFKPLNDTYGHSAGDKLLIEAGHRIGSCVRETDTVSRFGGDEFVVMLTELDEEPGAAKQEAALVAEKIRNALAVSYSVDIEGEGDVARRIEHVCTASIGVVIFDSQSQQEDIFRCADMAMYDAKHMGRNRIVVVDPRGAQGEANLNAVRLRLIWNDAYECGERTIDAEHRRLFELANALIESAFDRNGNPAAFETALNEMLAHLERHFADEEEILEKHGYPELEDHVRAHRLLLKHALSLRDGLMAGGVTTGELVSFIAEEVVTQHMLRIDRLFYTLFDSGSS